MFKFGTEDQNKKYQLTRQIAKVGPAVAREYHGVLPNVLGDLSAFLD